MLTQLKAHDHDPDVAALAAAPAADVVSVIVPVLGAEVPVVADHAAYEDALRAVASEVEFVCVLGRDNAAAREALMRLKDAGAPLVIVVLGTAGDEAALLRSGLRAARGGTIVTLSGAAPIDPEDVLRMLEALAGCDMALGRRASPAGSGLDRVQAATFHWLVRTLFGRAFSDLACRVRACRRVVLEEIAGYGVPAHFVPLIAAERGFRLCEVEVRERPAGAARRPGYRRFAARARLALDALALFVVLKFIRRPLRFCGALGLPILLAGVAFTAALGVARLIFDVPLADRPALILGVLLTVLGLQVLALGLIGEIIVFATGKRIKDYTIDKIL